MGMPKNLLFVEDHSSFRQGLSSVLRIREGLQVTQAGTLKEARSRMSAEIPDVALVDLGLSDADGIEVIQELHRADPQMPILVLTINFDTACHERAIEAGASKVITKDAPLEEILAAVEEATGV